MIVGGFFIGLHFVFYPTGMYFWNICGMYLLGVYALHNYKCCILNLELQNDKIKFKHIPFKLKYQVVNIVNEK